MIKHEIDKLGIEWLRESIVLLTVAGSHARGTSLESSDKDYAGVYAPPINYYLGLESVEKKNFQHVADTTDVSIIHIGRFVKNAMMGDVNSIEMLFARQEDYLKITEVGQMLIDNRYMFITKNIYGSFRGYANRMFKRFRDRKLKGTDESEEALKYGYNTKLFSDSMRLLTSAKEILETGDFSTYRPNREFLLDCRNGKYTFEEAVEMFETYDVELKKNIRKSRIPRAANYDKINDFLIRVNKKALSI